MTAWLVITAQVRDRDAFLSGYAPAAAALVQKMGGRYVVRARGAETLEGPSADGASTVISEWPDREAATAFWNSHEYREVKKLREGIAEVTVLLVSNT